MSCTIQVTEDWYQNSYRSSGFSVQRRYPNEELLWFMGRNFFGVPLQEHKKIRILEIGCDSCANLWMVACKSFNTNGIVTKQMKRCVCVRRCLRKGRGPELRVRSMTELPYENESLDFVLDVFSVFCLDEKGFHKYL